MRLCECGCGQETPIATHTNNRRGVVRGEPMRFVHGHNRVVRDRVAHFWSLVDKTDDGCWTWKGQSCAEFGYGLIRWRNGVGRDKRPLLRAHRVSWELANGPIPDGLFVLHSCDNPPCVRPDHLFLGTNDDNHADMVAKGRQRCGARRRLTANEIEQIERLASTATRAAIARAFKLSVPTVRKIARRVEQARAS